MRAPDEQTAVGQREVSHGRLAKWLPGLLLLLAVPLGYLLRRLWRRAGVGDVRTARPQRHAAPPVPVHPFVPQPAIDEETAVISLPGVFLVSLLILVGSTVLLLIFLERVPPAATQALPGWVADWRWFNEGTGREYLSPFSPIPVLRGQSPQDRLRLTEAELEHLNSYGVVDEEEQIFRVPLARAMEEIVRRGPAP